MVIEFYKNIMGPDDERDMGVSDGTGSAGEAGDVAGDDVLSFVQLVDLRLQSLD